jgi:hypothetical protein
MFGSPILNKSSEVIVMAKDWYVEQGRARMQQISAARASAVADLQMAKSAYDDDSATIAIQTIADVDAQRANLSALYDQYVRSQYPPQPPEPTKEERAARPLHAMDWNDIVDMTRQSKYARNIRPDDPNMIAGWQEAQRRRARGE